MPKLSTFIIWGFTGLVTWLMQVTHTVDIKGMGEMAGIWAFIIIVLDRLLSFLLKFRKDPVVEKLELVAANQQTLANNISEVVTLIKVTEDLRGKSMAAMGTTVTSMSDNIAKIAERTTKSGGHRGKKAT